MLDLNQMMAFVPSTPAQRVKKSEPKPRVYSPGKARGFQALSAEEQEQTALEKYAECYRLSLQWDHNQKTSIDVRQKHFAGQEIIVLERRLDHWSRYIISDEGVKELRLICDQIKRTWRQDDQNKSAA